jgi:hypothetical protein
VLRLHLKVFASHFGDGAVSSTDEQVPVGKGVDAVDSLLEKNLGWTDSLEQLSIKGDFNDIACLGAKVGESVALVNYASRKDALDVAHVHIRVLNLLGYEVDVPDLDAVVVDAEQLSVSVVEEPDLVGGVSPDWVSADSFSGLDVPDNQLVVVLSSERSEVALIERRGERLDQNFVQFQALDGLQRVEVPDDDISLESHVSLLA